MKGACTLLHKISVIPGNLIISWGKKFFNKKKKREREKATKSLEIWWDGTCDWNWVTCVHNRKVDLSQTEII